ncbi:MAG TPA: FAD-dependent oxidoreductase [Geminicoccaceae bacterium]|nr:FAD-dependent oxidoreductase [Geminicoccaceae bacterium]
MARGETALLIVGAGQAGGRAALTLRDQGYDGRVVLLGAEPSPPYERPPLSKGYLTGERAAADFTFAKADALAAAGIEFRPGCAVAAIDRRSRTVRLGDGERIGYTKLLLATGREPRRLPLDGAVAERVLYLRDLGDADQLRQALRPGATVAIVGGGFIGLEVAASAVALGCRPVVIELLPRLLGRAVPAPIAAFLEARHAAAGVEILLGARLQTIALSGERFDLALEGGRVIEADAVLVGIGAVPRAELAEAAGLPVDGGIVVDATLVTADPDIFAAGDVCAFPHAMAAGLLRLECWKSADAQGALAARNMLGAGEAYADVPWFWSDQYELMLQMAGLPERGAVTVARDVGAEARMLFHLDGDGRLVGVSGVGPPALARDLRIGQIMIERGLAPDPAALADPATRMKALLR